jgi:phage tail-like protein
MTSHAADALTASSFSLTVDGVEIGQFSELVELKSEIDPSALASPPDTKGTLPTKKVPVRRPPPTVTLKRGKNMDLGLFAWHSDAVSASQTARRDAVLAIRDAEGRPISRYHLENAWPSKVEISGLKAGASEVLYETVTLVCEKLERVNP